MAVGVFSLAPSSSFESIYVSTDLNGTPSILFIYGFPGWPILLVLGKLRLESVIKNMMNNLTVHSCLWYVGRKYVVQTLFLTGWWMMSSITNHDPRYHGSSFGCSEGFTSTRVTFKVYGGEFEVFIWLKWSKTHVWPRILEQIKVSWSSVGESEIKPNYQLRTIFQIVLWIPWVGLCAESLTADKILKVFVLSFVIENVCNFRFFFYIDLNMLGFWLVFFHNWVRIMLT